jgi:hypothetical protein
VRRTLPDPDFDLERAKARANTGAFFLTLGVLGFVAATVFGAYSGATGEDEFLLVGTCIEGASLFLFIPGLVTLVKNKKLIRNHEAALSGASRPALRLGFASARDSRGFTVAVSF